MAYGSSDPVVAIRSPPDQTRAARPWQAAGVQGGGVGHGDCRQALDADHVASGWTETQALPNKAPVGTFEALRVIRARPPFPLQGIDSDNGGELIDRELPCRCGAASSSSPGPELPGSDFAADQAARANASFSATVQRALSVAGAKLASKLFFASCQASAAPSCGSAANVCTKFSFR